MGKKFILTQLLPFSHTSMVLTERFADTQRDYVNQNNLQFHLQTVMTELPKAFASIRLFSCR